MTRTARIILCTALVVAISERPAKAGFKDFFNCLLGKVTEPVNKENVGELIAIRQDRSESAPSSTQEEEPAPHRRIYGSGSERQPTQISDSELENRAAESLKGTLDYGANKNTILVHVPKNNPSAAEIVDRVIVKTLGSDSSRFIKFRGNVADADKRMRSFVLALKDKFPEQLREIDPSGPFPTVNANNAVDSLLRSELFTGEKPLVLYVHDFEPTSDSQEPLSTWIRSLAERGYENVLIVMSSRHPKREWGAAQSGFNVGTQLELEDH